MSDSYWKQVVDFINKHEIGHVIKRSDLQQFARVKGISPGTVDGHRSMMLIGGFLRPAGRGKYEVSSKIPEGTSTTEMYMLKKGDRLKYLEMVVSRKERTKRRIEQKQVEDALREINTKIVTEAISQACLECKGSFPRVAMTFSYRQTPSRHKTLSKMILGETSTLLTELQKCNVVCMNCHLIKYSVGRLI
jgi:hypothetical protein